MPSLKLLTILSFTLRNTDKFFRDLFNSIFGKSVLPPRLRSAWPGLKSVVWSIVLLLILVSPLSAQSKSDRQHIVYFEGTPQELVIYKIYGRYEGPTIMVMGGIQGDEPGAFMSADLYVDMALKRGNLIVVPRANFKSIILFDRGPDGDMNRKFAGVQDMDPDRDRVEIIKNLMAESDVFLNLHDGSGFYRTVWESDLANPSRYGQCIIADSEVYTHPETGRVINLGQDARKAIALINEDIHEEKYKFSFSNHDTLSESSAHKEQRKSASYYALTKLGIPAYGIETSKQLPSLEMKIHQHNLAVNAFMKIFGVIPEQPRIKLEPPILHYLVISINGNLPVAVADGQTLMISPGNTIEVVHIGANYDRGLSVDVLGAGTLNDIRMPLVIDKTTKVIARKDNQTFGQISLKFLPPGSTGSPQLLVASNQMNAVEAGAGWLPGMTPPPPEPKQPEVPKPERSPLKAEDLAKNGPAIASAGSLAGIDRKKYQESLPEPPASDVSVNGISGFILTIDGQTKILRPNEILSVRYGAQVTLVDLEKTEKLPNDTVMNLRGFVGRPGDTTGNDLGTTANTAKDMISRFSKVVKGRRVYQLGAEHGPELLASAYLEITQPRLKSVTLVVGGQEKVLALGQRWGVTSGTPVTVKEINLDNELELVNPRFTLGGRAFPSNLPQTLTMPSIAVSLAVFTDNELAGKVVIFPKNN
ncbi:MAG: hypothetical protein LBS44_03850 [Deltaproteobacteria bacterium]|jgi:hypothetical protein|nr:hypothetical protein [Deltaproteobacteria bacterium]